MKSAATSAHRAAPLRSPHQRLFRRLLPAGVAILAAIITGACTEQLETGTTCPLLCPGQSVAIRDTVISPVLVFDTTFVGYPVRGTEPAMLLATRGDTMEMRGVVRFDTLISTFRPLNDTAHTISSVDSVRLRLVIDPINRRLPSSVTFEAYDVDGGDPIDTSSATVNARFVSSRRIGTLTLANTAVTDTVYLPLSKSAFMAKLASNPRLRVGLRVFGSGSVWMNVKTEESGLPVLLSYYPTTTDTSVKPIVSAPAAAIDPRLPEEIRRDLNDYQLVAKYNVPVAAAGTMTVGGLPGRRSYLRFNLPSALLDSTTIVRATLRLTQRPFAVGDLKDTIIVNAQVVLAGPAITDLRRASEIIAGAGLFVLDSLALAPRDSGQRSIEMYSLVRSWALQTGVFNSPPRAVVLKGRDESLTPMEAWFFGSKASASLRPTMRISYIPKTEYGKP